MSFRSRSRGAFAQISIDSFGPTSFYSFEFEQNATIHGVDLFGDFYGAPDSDNIFLSTQLIFDGPAGTFTRGHQRRLPSDDHAE